MKTTKTVRAIEKNAVRLLVKNVADTVATDKILAKVSGARKKITGIIALN